MASGCYWSCVYGCLLSPSEGRQRPPKGAKGRPLESAWESLHSVEDRQRPPIRAAPAANYTKVYIIRIVTILLLSVPEVAHAGEEHGDAVLVARLDAVLVLDRAARLD